MTYYPRMTASFLLLRWPVSLAIIGSILFFSAGVMAQKPPRSTYPGPVYTSVQQLAEFPGGRTAMLKFMAEHIDYPAALDKMKYKTGAMKVRFIVAPDGTLHDITVDSPPVRQIEAQKGMDEYLICIIHAVEQMPKWRPARMNGLPVAMRYVVPIQVLD